MIGEEVVLYVTVVSLLGNELICEVKAFVNDRLVAIGKTGQKILKKEKIKQLFKSV